jgi:hypothetical protein
MSIIMALFAKEIDRARVEQTTLDQADIDDIHYWMNRTPSEKMAGVEHLRRWIY